MADNTLLEDEVMACVLSVSSIVNRTEQCPAEKFRSLTKSCFSSAKFSKAMKSGTVDEKFALRALRRKEFIVDIHGCGMICDKELTWLACLLDCLAVLDMQKTTFRGGSQEEAITGLTSVEIKNGIAESSLSKPLLEARVESICAEPGDNVLRRQIPRSRVDQITQQMLVLRADYIL